MPIKCSCLFHNIGDPNCALSRPAPDPAMVERLERVRAHHEFDGVIESQDVDWLLNTLETLLGIKNSK